MNANTLQRSFYAGLSSLAILLVCGQSAFAQVNDTTRGSDIFPASTALYLQLDDGGQLLDAILNHPIRQRIEKLDDYKKAMRSPQMLGAKLVVTMIEGQLEQSWQDAVRNITGNVYFCIDRETEGMALLLRANDEGKLKRTAGTLLAWVKSEAEKRGDDPPELQTYRGIKVAEMKDNALMGRWKNWLLLSNKGELAKRIADNLLDHDGDVDDRLSGMKWFQNARSKANSKSLWGTVHLEELRKAGVAKELFAGKADNPGAELILGGIYDGLKDAEYAVFGVDLDRDLKITATLPFDRESANQARKFFYGPDFDGRAPQPLIPENMIANLISYRDVSDWWLSKEDLYEENVIAQLAQADSQLSTFFGNMDFGQEVLGAIKPGVQIVVAQQNLPDGYDPDIKLPSFGFVGKLKDPSKVQRKFKRAFQSVIGIANLNLSMNGQPQLDLETIKDGDSAFSVAEYALEDEDDKPLIIYNFSPTIGFHEDYLFIASTKSLAFELAELAKKNGGPAANTNTRMEIFASPMANVLKQNKDSLVAQNMLEEGSDLDEAEQQISILLSVVEFLKKSQLDLQVLPDQIRLDFELQFDGQE